ncbi:RHS repeat protein, partial [Puniceicoccaceae bacterium K14]|nr:RHS repeat protein [Puniceicoccaceae bacterium K14]
PLFEAKDFLSKTTEPFQDNNGGKVTTYTYTATGTGDSVMADVKEVKILGQTVSKVDNDYVEVSFNGEPVIKQTKKEYFGAGSSDYVATITYTYAQESSDKFLRGKPLAIVRPDGTQSSWAYWDVVENVSYEGIAGTTTVYGKKSLRIDGLRLYGSMPSGYQNMYELEASGTYPEIVGIRIKSGQSEAVEVYVDAAGLPYKTIDYICEGGNTFSGNFSKAGEERRTYDLVGNLVKTERVAHFNGSTSSQVTFEASYDSGQLSEVIDETGMKTTYEYDGRGRLQFETVASQAASSSSFEGVTYATPLVEEFKKEYYYTCDMVADVQTFEGGGNKVLWDIFFYDKAGRLTKNEDSSLSGMKQDLFDYSVIGEVTATSIDGRTVTTRNYRDGTVESVTGDTVPQYILSEANADGLRVQTASNPISSVGSVSGLAGWKIIQYDWLGREVYVREPTLGGGDKYVNYEYDEAGRVEAIKTGTSIGASNLAANYLYYYDDEGRLWREGLDAGGSGLSVYSSYDRLTDSESYYEKSPSGHWNFVTETYAYPSYNNKQLTSLVRTRLFPSAGVLSLSEVEDHFGNLSSAWTRVDRAKGTTATLGVSAGASNSNISVSKLGLLIHEKGSAGDELDYTYDGLRRRTSAIGRDDILTLYEYKPFTYALEKVVEDHGSSFFDKIEYEYLDGRLSKEIRKNYSGSQSLPDEVVNYTYDNLGNVSTRTGNGTNPVKFEYDSYGRLFKQTQYRNDSLTSSSIVEWLYDNATGLAKEKHHFKGGTAQKEFYKYNKLHQVTQRKWARGVYTNYSYSYGSNSSTGDLIGETHFNGYATPSVSYTYDKMGRKKTISDITGTRTFDYNESNGLAVSRENLSDSFYGAGNDLNFLYEGTGSGELEGRYQGLTFGDVSWEQTYSSQTGLIATVKASKSGSSSFSKTFSYSYDNNSSHVSSVISGNYKQYRYHESIRENYSGTTTKWGSSNRARYDSSSFSGQNQLLSYKLQYDGNSSLAYRLGATSDIAYGMDFDSRHQVESWDSSRTSGTDNQFTWDSAGNPSSFDGQGFSANSLNEIQPLSGGSYGYDLDGNLTGDFDWDYVYDANNRLVKMTNK